MRIATFGRLLKGEPDALPGYRRERVRNTDPGVIAASGADHHPIVRKSDAPGDRVAGTVFEVTRAERDAADDHEVADDIRVAARLSSGREAWVHVEAPTSWD